MGNRLMMVKLARVIFLIFLCLLEKKEEMGDKSQVLEAVLKETVDWGAKLTVGK
ncbi:hypothetical protein ACJW30_02G105600 [Castanea mollissima]